jgi:hypothetical protein
MTDASMETPVKPVVAVHRESRSLTAFAAYYLTTWTTLHRGRVGGRHLMVTGTPSSGSTTP